MEIDYATLKIVKYPHPALRHVARPLTNVDRKVQLVATRMLELMYEHAGLGLAGPQVGLPFRIFVANYAGDPEKPDLQGVFINPEILEKKGTQEGDEGCLSFPELFQKVRRAKTVKVEAYDLTAQRVEFELSDLQARIWQHEIDHLDGKLFIDKFGTIAKLASRGALKDFERDYRKSQTRGEIPPDPEIEAALKQLEELA
jgi:peptide deformylase